MARGVRLVVAVAACVASVACSPQRPPETARKLPEIAWIRSEKLDVDLQEFVLRAYDEDLVFPFRVTLAAPLAQEEIDRLATQGIVFEGEGRERVALAQPRQVETFVTGDVFARASCAAVEPAPRPDGDEAWREKVDPDVRLVYAAKSSCWFGVRLVFAPSVRAESREALEELGARVFAFDGRSSIAFVPVRAIPAFADLGFVSSIVPASHALEP